MSDLIEGWKCSEALGNRMARGAAGEMAVIMPTGDWSSAGIIPAAVLVWLVKPLTDAAEQRGRDEAAGKWVACSERMPEPNLFVLVAFQIDRLRSVEMGAWDAVRRVWVMPNTDVADDGTELSEGAVTHWQQIPAPPGETP